jgi:hypothetical protein
MITAADIRHLRTASEDYPKAEAMKAHFRKQRTVRTPFFLTARELDRIFKWKLRSQYGRQKARRARNSDAAYRAVTEAVFKVVSADWDYECAVRLRLLSALEGVAVPVASAILALTEPELYCVIDFRGWRAVFGRSQTAFTVTDYLRYRREVARLAAQLGWPVQEADAAIWEYDRERSRRSA